MIFFQSKTNTFYLQGKNVSYVFRKDEYGFLNHLYFGKKVACGEDLSFVYRPCDRGFSPNFDGAENRSFSLDTMPNEYPGAGLGDYRRPAVMVRTRDGARQTDFRYIEHSIETNAGAKGLPHVRGGETLCVRLRDDRYALTLELYYTVWDDSDAVVRRAALRNDGNDSVHVLNLCSFSIDLPDADYQSLRLSGRPCSERAPVWQDCAPGICELSSGQRGSSSHYLNPFLALKRKNTDETQGEVYGFQLVYSGSFSLSAEYTQYGGLRVRGGIDPLDFDWLLQSGEKFETPESVLVYSDGGLGGMSHCFHSLCRKHLMNPDFAFRARPVLVNSWEAVYFDFDEKKLFRLIELAARAGMDMFVLDDGWFTCRNDDNGGLGDWEEDLSKLPCGLKGISEKCRSLNLSFGLWFEPEMVSENSKLFRTHPEWCLKNPERGFVRGRNQIVLDFCNPQVVDYVYGKMEDIIDKNGISYVKWDMNRYLADLYSPYLPPERQSEVQHRYVLGVYELASRLNRRFPDLLMEGCSGGGGRFDAGMLNYFPQIWTSDNTDAFARAQIQYGTSFCYPPSAMTAHVSVCPNHQTGRTSGLDARYAVASSCIFGYELDLTKLSQSELDQIKEQITAYKRDADFVMNGDFYRLSEGDVYAFAQVSCDKSRAYVTGITGLKQANDKFRFLKIYGLDCAKMYRVRETGQTMSGRVLESIGLPLPQAEGDFFPICYHLDGQPSSVKEASRRGEKI